jgi:hypothetical protein
LSDKKGYSLEENDNILVFTTASFRAEKSSVLHSGIYNYEFSSILSASFVCGIVYVLAAVKYRVSLDLLLVIVVLFITVFVLFRRFVFRDKSLKVVFDRSERSLKIYRPFIIGCRSEELSFEDIASVEVGSKSIALENLDAVRFVQKISLQHGSEVPGLGDEEEFVTLSLKLRDATERLIYAGKVEGNIEGEPEMPLKEIQDFLATDLPTGRQALTD